MHPLSNYSSGETVAHPTVAHPTVVHPPVAHPTIAHLTVVPDSCPPDNCSPDSCSPDSWPPDSCPPDNCSPDSCSSDSWSPNIVINEFFELMNYVGVSNNQLTQLADTVCREDSIQFPTWLFLPLNPSRAADCTHIGAHCAAINNLYCNNSNQLRICADIYACVLQLKVFAPQCAFVLYVKLLFILKYRCAAMRRSAAIKQICTAMRRTAAIREVCAAYARLFFMWNYYLY